MIINVNKFNFLLSLIDAKTSRDSIKTTQTLNMSTTVLFG